MYFSYDMHTCLRVFEAMEHTHNRMCFITGIAFFVYVFCACSDNAVHHLMRCLIRFGRFRDAYPQVPRGSLWGHLDIHSLPPGRMCNGWGEFSPRHAKANPIFLDADNTLLYIRKAYQGMS